MHNMLDRLKIAAMSSHTLIIEIIVFKLYTYNII